MPKTHLPTASPALLPEIPKASKEDHNSGSQSNFPGGSAFADTAVAREESGAASHVAPSSDSLEVMPALPAEFQPLRDAFEDAARAESTALRTVVRCGLLMLAARKRAKKSEFGPWLKSNVFPDFSAGQFESQWRKARRYMDLTTEICSALGVLSGETYAIPIGVLGDNGHHVRYLVDAVNNGTQEVSLADVILLAPEALPSGAREIQLKLFELIDGKTQKQLSFELRSERQKHEYHPSHKTVEDRLADAKWQITEETKCLVRSLTLYPAEEFPLLAPAAQRDLRLALDNLKARLPRA